MGKRGGGCEDDGLRRQAFACKCAAGATNAHPLRRGRLRSEDPRSRFQARAHGTVTRGESQRAVAATAADATGTGRGTMRIVEIDFESDPRWDEFVTGHPDGLVYHHSQWLSALWHECGQRPSRSRTRTNSCSFAVFCLSCTRTGASF